MQREWINVSDEELARQARAGCLLSFEELVTRHEAGVFRFLARCCRNEEDARDLSQTTFVAAFQSLSQFKTEGKFGPWLFTIARRKFIDHYRARRPAASLAPHEEDCDHNDPAAILDRRERQHDIWSRARGALPEAQFSALWLKYQQDLSVAEIARVLQRTQTSVKVLLFRGRQGLLRVFEGRQAEAAAVGRAASAKAGHNLGCFSQAWKGAQPATTASADTK